MSRLHVGADVGTADVHLIVDWPAGGCDIRDAEEAIKAAARSAVWEIRDRMKQRR